MGEKSIEQQIKDFILTECHQNKVGIASIDRFNSSPKGMHPCDVLPGCQSVISFCTRVPDGAINATLRAYENGKFNVHGQYALFGYVGSPNYNLLWGNYKAARFVEKLTGEIAVPQTAGPTHGMAMLSMRHLAVAAGLGQFGWNSIVLTPEFGPRNRFGAILTTAKLKADPMMDGPRLCDYKKCHICEKVCPTGAIPPYRPGQERIVDFGEGHIEKYSCINWTKCKLACEGDYKDWNINGDFDLIDPLITNPLNEEFVQTQQWRGKPENVDMHFYQHTTTWKCGNCMQYCPVGRWKERYRDKSISDFDGNQYIDGVPDVSMDVYNGKDNFSNEYE